MVRSLRNSNIEILRIISMFLIVLSHYTVHNGVNNIDLSLGFNRFLLEFCSLGNIGVIIFALITGFYSVGKKNPFKLKRLMSMIFQVMFYSIGIYLIFCAIGMEQFSVPEFLTNAFPITFRKYWFISVFILLYILTPFINALIENLSRQYHFRLICVLLVLFSILPLLTNQHFYGNELVQFVMFYVIGAYLGKYQDNFFCKKKNSLIVLVATLSIVVVSILVLDLLSLNWLKFGEYSTILLNRKSLASILIAVSIFSLFKERKPFTNGLINSVAGCVLGVYLISDNNYIRDVLWTGVLNVPNYVGESTLIIHMLVSVIVVFATCVVIEFIRLHTFEKVFSLVYDSVEKKIRRVRRRRCKNE